MPDLTRVGVKREYWKYSEHCMLDVSGQPDTPGDYAWSLEARKLLRAIKVMRGPPIHKVRVVDKHFLPVLISSSKSNYLC